MKEILSEGTLMHIYFKELGVVKYQRDELYGIMDVIGKNGAWGTCHLMAEESSTVPFWISICVTAF